MSQQSNTAAHRQCNGDHLEWNHHSYSLRSHQIALVHSPSHLVFPYFYFWHNHLFFAPPPPQICGYLCLYQNFKHGRRQGMGMWKNLWNWPWKSRILEKMTPGWDAGLSQVSFPVKVVPIHNSGHAWCHGQAKNPIRTICSVMRSLSDPGVQMDTFSGQ
jgi:hypothetical protein